jgi:glutathione S-transferase
MSAQPRACFAVILRAVLPNPTFPMSIQFTDVAAIAAILQYLQIGSAVGKARYKYDVKAPAVTGNENFERLYRVQMNTLELLIALLPSMYIAAKYFPDWSIAIGGAIYIIGRYLYWRGYVSSPETRTVGFLMSFLPIGVFALAALAGALFGFDLR